MSDEFFRRALGRREDLLAKLAAERTDCYRLFHGVAEGRPGLTIDRYGPVLLLQTWKEGVTRTEIDRFHRIAESALSAKLTPIWNDRTAAPIGGVATDDEPVGRELGARYHVTPRHRGQDPLLFLDFRAGRRRILDDAHGKSVLNLFAYTGTASVCAALGGATEVWSVDFARSAADWTERNLELNSVARERVRILEEDALPVLRQLAGLPVKGRGSKRRSYKRLEPRSFDRVILDPPRWSKSAFGAVDVMRDYPSLLKPALLATSPGGALLVTNNASRVSRDDWLAVLTRTADKCGRRVAGLDVIVPEDDFPSRDGEPPLKIAWLQTE